VYIICLYFWHSQSFYVIIPITFHNIQHSLTFFILFIRFFYRICSLACLSYNLFDMSCYSFNVYGHTSLHPLYCQSRQMTYFFLFCSSSSIFLHFLFALRIYFLFNVSSFCICAYLHDFFCISNFTCWIEFIRKFKYKI